MITISHLHGVMAHYENLSFLEHHTYHQNAVHFLPKGKSLECLIRLSLVWCPVEALLISRFINSTYSSRAMFLFLPHDTFINLFCISLSVWSLERVPDVRRVRWMLPIRYLVLPVFLYNRASYFADLIERAPSAISTA